MANIPGTPAKHAIITDTCRANRTDRGAFDEAIERLRQEYDACMKGHPNGLGTQFHLVLTVERAAHADRTPAGCDCDMPNGQHVASCGIATAYGSGGADE